MYFGGTVGHTRCGLAEIFIGGDAGYAGICIEFIDVEVALMILGTGIEHRIRSGIDGTISRLGLVIFRRRESRHDVLVVRLVFYRTDIEFAFDKPQGADTIFGGTEGMLEEYFKAAHLGVGFVDTAGDIRQVLF